MTCERDAIALSKLPDAIRAKIDTRGECWKWKGRMHAQSDCPMSIPLCRMDGRNVVVYRLLYALSIGIRSVPQNVRITRDCGCESCVRPSHIRVVNVARPGDDQASNKIGLQTNCPKCGSPYRTFKFNGQTRVRCGLCSKASQKRYKRSLKEKREAEIGDAMRESKRSGSRAYWGRLTDAERQLLRDVARNRRLLNQAKNSVERSRLHGIIAELHRRFRASRALVRESQPQPKPRGDIEENIDDPEIYRAVLARVREEGIADTLDAKPPPPPPPVDRKEAIRRRLLAEIEEMAKTRSDD